TLYPPIESTIMAARQGQGAPWAGKLHRTALTAAQWYCNKVLTAAKQGISPPGRLTTFRLLSRIDDSFEQWRQAYRDAFARAMVALDGELASAHWKGYCKRCCKMLPTGDTEDLETLLAGEEAWVTKEAKSKSVTKKRMIKPRRTRIPTECRTIPLT